MFTLKWTAEADRQYRELRDRAEQVAHARVAKRWKKSSRDEGLFKQVQKARSCCEKTPGTRAFKHTSIARWSTPSRKTEKVFEAYAQDQTPGAYRVFWCYGPERGEMTIIAITPHP